ncbi:tetratricopeptide repeat protein [Methanosarcina sp. T3]|uniref:tetratricopeptide repeat protein n=1 Tax=Methanosarcina sp. T3 TaxID=3439062 RepID=UPI003F877B4C
MDLDMINKLIFGVVELVRENEDETGAGIEFAIQFSRKNGISPDFLLNIAKICDSKEMFREEYVFMKACALMGEGEQQIEAYFLSGVLAYFMGRKETALREFDEALKLDPGHVNSLCNQGIVLAELGRKVEAESRYRQALELEPGHISTHCNYGNLFFELGKLLEAEREFRAVLELDPENANNRCNYANLLVELGRKEEAEEHFRLVLEQVPEHVSANYSHHFK